MKGHLKIKTIPSIKDRINKRSEPLNDEQKKFIDDNHSRMTVTEIKLKIKKAPKTIYKYMEEKKITPFKKGFGQVRSKTIVPEGCFEHDKNMFI